MELSKDAIEVLETGYLLKRMGSVLHFISLQLV